MRCYASAVRESVQLLRLAAIVAGILFALVVAWIVLIGPALLVLLKPHA
jgi:hypothetical protein